MPKSNIEVRRGAVTMCGTEVLNPGMMMFTYRFWFIYMKFCDLFFLDFLHRCLLNYFVTCAWDRMDLFQTKTENVIGLLRRNGNKFFFLNIFTSMALQKAIFWDVIMRFRPWMNVIINSVKKEKNVIIIMFIQYEGTIWARYSYIYWLELNLRATSSRTQRSSFIQHELQHS